MTKRQAKKIYKKYNLILDSFRNFLAFSPYKKLTGYDPASVHLAYKKLNK